MTAAGRALSPAMSARATARPQRNGWLLAECTGCGMKVRVTRRAAQASGLPLCGCGAGPFAAADETLKAALGPSSAGSPFEQWAKAQTA